MRNVLFAVLLMFAGPALCQESTASGVLDAAVNQAIRPAMAEFRREASGLEAAMGALCASPEEQRIAIARQSFAEAAVAYGRIEFIRIGPLMEENRAERLLFFPDRKGIGLRLVQAILAEQDQGATEVASLREKSVAVQGFGALEFVLHGTGAEALGTAEGAFRCRFGQAIATNISRMAEEMAWGWYQQDGIAVHLMRPAAEYSDYRTQVEALEEIVSLVSHGLEAVRDTRLNPFMAKGEDAAKPKQALLWRSGLTMAMVRANLEGMHNLVEQSGMARHVDEKDRGLDNSIAFEFSNAVRALDLVTSPVEQAVADPKQVQALNYLALVTGSLQAMIGEQLATAMGLSVGFSSLDGD
jgi:predicted lipoprotein